jgi:hypothetical protein
LFKHGKCWIKKRNKQVFWPWCYSFCFIAFSYFFFGICYWTLKNKPVQY